MKVSRRCALSLLAFGIAAGAGAQDARLDRWTESRFAHYRVVSDHDGIMPARLAFRFARMEHLLDSLFAEGAPPWNQELIAVAFTKERDYQPFAPSGKSRYYPAYVIGRPRVTYMVLHLEDEDELWDRVQHELVHYWLGKHAPRLPSWLNEGLAMFFESVRFEGDSATIGIQLRDAAKMLASMKKLLPAKELVEYSYQGRMHSAPHEVGEFYAQSWLAVHYLVLGGHHEKLRDYVALIREHADPYAAYQQAIGFEDADFDQRLREHFRQITSGGRAVRVELAQDFVVQKESVRKLAPAEVKSYFGAIAGAFDDDDVSSRRLLYEEARLLDSECAAAWHGLALLHLKEAEPELAYEKLRQAIALDEEFFEAHLELGSRLRAYPNHAEEARASLMRAMKLRPDDPYALGFWAASHLHDDPALGLRALEVVTAQLPWDAFFCSTATAMRAMNGDVVGARAELESLRRWVEPSTIQWLELLIEDMEQP